MRERESEREKGRGKKETSENSAISIIFLVLFISFSISTTLLVLIFLARVALSLSLSVARGFPLECPVIGSVSAVLSGKRNFIDTEISSLLFLLRAGRDFRVSLYFLPFVDLRDSVVEHSTILKYSA